MSEGFMSSSPWRWIHHISVGLAAISLVAIGIQVLEIEPSSVLGAWRVKANDTSTSNTTSSPVEMLTLNENATLADDLISIAHYADQAKLVVTLRADGRCPRPYLIGRLAGPALIRVENWTRSKSTSNATVATMEGSYQAPVGGTYFLEIVAMFCEDLLYQLAYSRQPPNHTTNLYLQDTWKELHTPANDLLRIDIQGVCMVNPNHHRLTAQGTAIQVDHKVALDKQLGYWWFNASRTTTGNPEDIATQHSNSTTTKQLRTVETAASTSNAIQPLYTRFQPTICYEAHLKKSGLPPECKETASMHRFDPYQFRWSQGLTVQHLKQPQPTLVCVMGYSHARTLWHAAERLRLFPNNTDINVAVRWVPAYYPVDVTAKIHIAAQIGCSHLILAVGQWPASMDQGRPMGLLEYYLRIQAMMQGLVVDTKITQQMKVFLRSIHYNPPSCMISACPPRDWRNPLVIDAYNSILQKVANEFDIPFLDTNFLIGAIWDSAPDWCHLNNHTSEQEMLYLAASVLGVVDNNNNNNATSSHKTKEDQLASHYT